MSDIQHLSSQFDEDLERLRNLIMQMGGMVETQISAVIDAYTAGDASNVKEIVADDRKIDLLEQEIDDHCAHVIARRQPTASDLRLIIGISKMVTDLERVGDEVKKIAKGVRRIHDGGHVPAQFGLGVRHLAVAAQAMVHDALDAFARQDSELAMKVIRADRELDIEFKAIIRQLVTHMMEDSRTISVSLEIITICRSIERVGDHAKNVCEHVIYIAEGRDIRHSKGKMHDNDDLAG